MQRVIDNTVLDLEPDSPYLLSHAYTAPATDQ
jgi:hypothetical protein